MPRIVAGVSDLGRSTKNVFLLTLPLGEKLAGNEVLLCQARAMLGFAKVQSLRTTSDTEDPRWPSHENSE
jgi:hypothetical protein